MGLAFKKAEKKQAKLRLAMTGPSGAGKTYSALKIASGMGKKIAVLDTENHSASLYAAEFEFDTLEIDAPYTIQKYRDGINAAVEAGYDVLIIDSISHAWAGEGGLLEKKGALDVRGGNSYTNWAPVTKEHEQFKATLLSCDIHLIVTMRSKMDYVVETNDKGKSAPRKIGLAPIQREGMEYEFTMVLDLGMDHNASVSKTRIKGFDGKIFTPDAKTGKELLAWLNDGSTPLPIKPPPVLKVHEEPKKEIDWRAEMHEGIEPNEQLGSKSSSLVTQIKRVYAKEYKPGKWRYAFQDTDEAWYSTFSKTFYDLAARSEKEGVPLEVEYALEMFNGKPTNQVVNVRLEGE